MHTGDSNAVLQAHEFSKHLRARNDWDVIRPRRRNLRILTRNRRTRDHNFSPGHIFSTMSDEDNGAQTRQTLRNLGIAEIRTRNFVAEVQQHLGDAAHADAADADKMNALD